MKVILQQDVKSLGKKGDIVDVSDGYAKNFILPKKLGIEANNKNINDLKLQRANEEKIAKQIYEDAAAFSEKLKGKEIIVSIKAGEGGKPFGSVSSKEIAREAKTQHGLELDKKKIQVKEPIRSFGTHLVAVRLHPKVTGELVVKVKEA